tara:strand:+ start:294 stop:422 length:129 start_codon:yes stop_codon:yes gene_type:complete
VVGGEKISVVMTNGFDANYPNFTVNGFETPIKSSFFTVIDAV